jgi:hypothetical protein
MTIQREGRGGLEGLLLRGQAMLDQVVRADHLFTVLCKKKRRGSILR